MSARETRLLEACVAGERLGFDDGLYLWEQGRWSALVEAAHAVRVRRHGAEKVGYTAFRVVNYTNVCTVDCSFCSFFEEVESGRGYALTLEQMRAKALEAKELGADQIFLQGGVHPDLPLDYYLEALSLFWHELKMHVRGFSPVELLRLAQKENMALPELLRLLKAAGLGSVPGAGAEILTERMRAILSPKKLTAQEWCDTMGACHEAGLPGSANIVFGSVETGRDILEHLQFVREQQDASGGFLSFVPWTFQPQTKRFEVRHVRGDEYLKMVALCRLWFDNIDHIEVSVLGLGKELGEVALRCGADDINSIVIEENVLASKGLKTLAAAQKFIREAGFVPARRSLCFDYSGYAN
jgi:cyclic dehypoxanthinyl futalosine synthase